MFLKGLNELLTIVIQEKKGAIYLSLLELQELVQEL